jgi:hypothetical protein
MPNATLSGTLYVQPSDASGAFPAGASSVPLSLSPSLKPLLVDSGMQKRNVASPLAFVALSGVGATDTVTQGTFLYLKTNAPMQVRMTFNNPAGGVTSAVTNVGSSVGGGQIIQEFDPTRWLTLLEVEGSGTVEWLVGGPL